MPNADNIFSLIALGVSVIGTPLVAWWLSRQQRHADLDTQQQSDRMALDLAAENSALQMLARMEQQLAAAGNQLALSQQQTTNAMKRNAELRQELQSYLTQFASLEKRMNDRRKLLEARVETLQDRIEENDAIFKERLQELIAINGELYAGIIKLLEQLGATHNVTPAWVVSNNLRQRIQRAQIKICH